MELGPTIWWSPLTESQIIKARKALSDEVLRQGCGTKWLSHDERLIVKEIDFQQKTL